MSESQHCGLCLSCGVPFMPSADDTDLFRHTGNLSVLFLNLEFKNNKDIQKQYEIPKFTSDKQASHVFHDSHHSTALNHMCNHHTADNDLAWPAPPLGPAAAGGGGATVIPDSGSGPLPYYKAPGSKRAKKPCAATWARPPQADRLDFSKLLTHVVAAAQKSTAQAFGQNMNKTFSLCRGCNSIMTQRNDMEFHLGLGGMRESNTDPIIKTSAPLPISQTHVDDHGTEVKKGYGAWTRRAGASYLAPKGKNDDDLTPAVAYYLHMCLPFIDAAGPANPFDAITTGANQDEMRHSARTLYLELCWLILEIACVATLKEQGRLYKPLGVRSHGPHQHAGVLDFYVSYFVFRLMHFEYTEDIQREGLDFVQWHQKYYTDATNCRELFKDSAGVARDGLLASMVYSTTLQSSRTLVEEICDGLMRLYTQTLDPLIKFTRGRQEQVHLPLGVKKYFLPLPAMRQLRRRSTDRVSISTHTISPFFLLWFTLAIFEIGRLSCTILNRPCVRSAPARCCTALSSCARTARPISGPS